MCVVAVLRCGVLCCVMLASLTFIALWLCCVMCGVCYVWCASIPPFPPLTLTHTQVEVMRKEEETVRVALKCKEMEILDLGLSSASEKQASALQVKTLRNQVEAMRYVLYYASIQ
jgi:hypothetical protein